MSGNLNTGDAAFTKIGAEPSYIIREAACDGISGSLPIGIVDEVRPVSIHKTLEPDDLIVAMSDGVSAAVGDDAAGWFADIPQTDAQTVAEAILQKARGPDPPRDDMTVIVGRVVDS